MRAGRLSCGDVITKSTTLVANIGPCAGDGIVIGADNILLNLNGHRVVGNNDQGASGEFAGIRLPGRTGVRVIGHPGGQRSGRTGTVNGFEAGVVIRGGSANTVESLTVRDNIGIDNARLAELGDGIIVFDSPANRILNNVVIHNGIFDGIGVLGETSDNTTIEGNTVEDTVGPTDGGPAGQGVIVNGADNPGCGQETCPPRPPQIITDSSVVNNIVRRNASGGLANINNIRATIVGNTVEDNGLTNAAGNGIGVQAGFGFRGYPTQVLVQGNEVHGNGWDGIQISYGAFENRIIDNDAADNNALSTTPGPFFDLRDYNRDCDANVWRGNIWGSGLFFPNCVTAGGSGPPLPPPVPEGPFGDPTCSDGFDNDQDGLIDVLTPGDPDCAPPPPPEGPEGDPSCGNVADDDQDGLADGADPDCQSDAPPVTEGPPGDPTCSDFIDNDRDGLIDEARDPDCYVPPPPPRGEGPPGSPGCSDGIDNDRDRLIDGADPDCQSP
jgi:hypothetical protein